MKANIPKSLTPKQQAEMSAHIAQESEARFFKMRNRLHDIDLNLTLMVLRSMGWGQIRLQRFMDRFMDTAEEYGNEYDEAMLEALKLHLKQSGFELKG